MKHYRSAGKTYFSRLVFFFFFFDFSIGIDGERERILLLGV